MAEGFPADVLTRIVNVSWGDVEQQWLVGISDDLGLSFWAPPFHALAADLRTQSGPSCGASGGGYTVLSEGPVAFGKLRYIVNDEEVVADHFLHASVDGNVALGTPTSRGIEWDTVWSIPSPGFDVNAPLAISYVNEAFYISYAAKVDAEGKLGTRLAVTRDGLKFKQNIDPFPTVPSKGFNFRVKWGGHVAYNSATGKYSTVGCTWGEIGLHFVWSVSTNGLDWADGFNPEPYESIGAQIVCQHSLIAAGKGKFVAAASYRNRFVQPAGGGALPDYIVHSCAVATSTNGTEWTVVKLPGAEVLSDRDGDYGGETNAVAFVRTSANSGYFVAAGFETGNRPGLTPKSKMWTSPNGVEWTQLSQSSGASFYGALSAIDKEWPASAKIVIR